MMRHELLDADGERQRTVFSDGTSVIVDLRSGEYRIEEGKQDEQNDKCTII